MTDLMQKLVLKIGSGSAPSLHFDDWEHRDYVEDVLSEHFDIDYDYLTEEATGECTLHFKASTSVVKLRAAIEAINRHHALSEKLYETV